MEIPVEWIFSSRAFKIQHEPLLFFPCAQNNFYPTQYLKISSQMNPLYPQI